jgi:hypothetical protein
VPSVIDVPTRSPARYRLALGGCKFRCFLNSLYYSQQLDFPARAAHASRSYFRMSNMTKCPATTPIPVQLSGPEFIAFIFPPNRG